jgi:nicotinamidase-related amidase
MAITTLDPITALVVIDLQIGLLGFPAARPISEIIASSAALARAFRGRGLPVALVTAHGRAPGRVELVRPMAPNPPPNWAQLVPELEPQPSDILIAKYTWGAFHATPLDLQLRRRGVTQIVLTGVATSMGVESTARAAYEHGYNVALAIDAMTDATEDNHRHSVERVFPRLGETATTAEILARLAA